MVRRLLPPYSLSAEYVKVFRVRAREIQNAQHPCLLRPLEFGLLEGIPHAVSVLPRGWQLSQLLDVATHYQRPIPVEVALSIVLSLTHLLATMHGRPDSPLVHGALEPGSVWLDLNGSVFVGDFEVGALLEYQARGHARGGEVGNRFQAPERAESWAQPPPSVDVYSVGNIALALLVAGRMTEVQRALGAVDQLAILVTQQVPKSVLQILAPCLREAPSSRPDMLSLFKQVRELLSSWPQAMSIAHYLRMLSLPVGELEASAPPEETLLNCLRETPRDDSLYAENTLTVSAGNLPPLEETTQKGAVSRSAFSPLKLLPFLLSFIVLLGLYSSRAQIAAFLSPPRMATATITSEPDGATVTQVGGASLGKTPTKGTVHLGEDGSVTLEASLPGYKSQQETRSAKAADRLTFHFALPKLEDGPATIKVITLPAGARIEVDGHSRGESPLEVPDLHSAKTHTVRASLKGYQTVTTDVKPTVGVVTEVKLELSASLGASTSPAGFLVVGSSPRSTLTIDGRSRGETGDRRHPLSVGAHDIRVMDMETGRVAEYTVTIQEGKTEVLSYSFQTGSWRMSQGGLP